MLLKIILGIDKLTGLTGLILLGSLVWSHFERHFGFVGFSNADFIFILSGAISVTLALFWSLFFLVAYFSSSKTAGFTPGLATFLISIFIAIIFVSIF
jgi:hypothetical protein